MNENCIFNDKNEYNSRNSIGNLKRGAMTIFTIATISTASVTGKVPATTNTNSHYILEESTTSRNPIYDYLAVTNFTDTDNLLSSSYDSQNNLESIDLLDNNKCDESIDSFVYNNRTTVMMKIDKIRKYESKIDIEEIEDIEVL